MDAWEEYEAEVRAAIVSQRDFLRMLYVAVETCADRTLDKILAAEKKRHKALSEPAVRDGED